MMAEQAAIPGTDPESRVFNWSATSRRNTQRLWTPTFVGVAVAGERERDGGPTRHAGSLSP